MQEVSKLHRNIVLHEPQVSLSQLMSKADVAIGAGGATNWERICLGVPSIVVTVAENQRKCAEYINKLGLINLIGDAETISDAKLNTELRNLINNPNLASWSQKCFDCFDGLGAEKIANIIIEAS